MISFGLGNTQIEGGICFYKELFSISSNFFRKLNNTEEKRVIFYSGTIKISPKLHLILSES